MHQRLGNVIGILVFVGNSIAGDDLESSLRAAQDLSRRGQHAEALRQVDRAIQDWPRDARPRLARGIIMDAQGRHTDAVAAFTQAWKLDSRRPEALDHRGSSRFKLGQFKESLADFDHYLRLQPQAKSGHWRRGITCYYAGQYQAGMEQFAAYQTVDGNDVENAVWWFLCAAKIMGRERAAKEMPAVGQDARVPLMVVNQLFRGRCSPAAVLSAIEAGTPSKTEELRQRFYGHLYLGLYFDSLGNLVAAKQHLELAAGRWRLPGYMADVGAVHLKLLLASKNTQITPSLP